MLGAACVDSQRQSLAFPGVAADALSSLKTRTNSPRLARRARLRVGLLCCALATTLGATGALAATTAPAATRTPSSPPALSTTQAHYLALAEQGVSAAETDWADPHHHWYDETLHDTAAYPLATIWDAVPLFESVDAIALAQPTTAHLAAVRSFARGAEGYLDHALRPVPGYAPYPGDRGANVQTWFDDNGWWGLAFVNAYRATGSTRYLTDAQRALTFIARAGWDPAGGGIWWDTSHPYKAGEALASGTLLATLLYLDTHSAADLAEANMFLAWGNTTGFSAANGLYAKSDTSAVPEDYIEAPLIFAQQALCQATGAQADCARAQTLTNTSLRRFGSELDFGPQYDAIYLQWMLAMYGATHDARLYNLAAGNAQVAAQEARNAGGLYLRTWTGEAFTPGVAAPNMLQSQAATTSLFAWLAVYQPPA